MNAVDSKTSYPPSLYAATANDIVARAPLGGDDQADVCIVGGGYTGLSAALHLAEHGLSVAVVEAERAGWGASGRNGGQLHSGQRRDPTWLEDRLCKADAQRLWALAEEAKALVRDLIARHGIDCDYQPGLIHAVHRARDVEDEHAFVHTLRNEYGYDAITPLDRDAIAAALGTDVYYGGWRDAQAGHLHPLNFALGLARAAEAAGARIFEKTRALSVDTGPLNSVVTANGRIRCDTVLLAGNGYMHGLAPEIEKRVLPINNFIVATDPLPDERVAALIPGRECASDSRFVINYWRITADNRMLFGGGENCSPRFPDDIAGFVRPYLLKIYPQLADCRIAYAWGGTLAITAHRVPYIRRVSSGVYAGIGYCGHGVGIATHTGKILADAIAKGDNTLDAYADLPLPPFPGGRVLRTPLLAAAMFWYGLMDRL
ncbi:MAG: FAD-binding oxidoreductase [Pseudomonadota bacterium]